LTLAPHEAAQLKGGTAVGKKRPATGGAEGPKRRKKKKVGWCGFGKRDARDDRGSSEAHPSNAELT
jgi:hypothetical protein